MKKKNNSFINFLVAVGNIEAQRKNQQMGMRDSKKGGLKSETIKSSTYLRNQRNCETNGF